MATLTDLKAAFFAAVTGKHNRTDAEMAYYQLAGAGGLPFIDPEDLSDGDTLVWNAGDERWEPATPYAGELTEGAVLTVVSGVPTWVVPA